ncbi:M20/M25/M40 family metallo-hydrolase [Humisphaera borealis]|uniref:Carboxypeptidase Q n=2 Tax=Humisphaera borealis TaxID=2807512 RepID=A0A7M2X3G0_9BACT|nr:M20/M25/M40 family metallo-hydrolase [Humisphaera borealis]
MTAPATRLSDDQLAKLAASRPSEMNDEPTTGPSTTPATSRTTTTTSSPATSHSGDLLVPRTGPDAAPATGPSSPAGQLAAARMATRMFAFVAAESPALVLSPTAKGDGGIHFVTGVALPTDPLGGGTGPATGPSTSPTTGPAAPATSPAATKPAPWSPNAPKTPPQVVLSTEDFNRLARIARRNIAIKVRVDLKVQFHDDDPMVPNVIAEIPGTDLADEIVMVGAHLDSWHSGTGATDNAAGSVAAMEAVRIIKALGLKPRRTIRIALWTGEEQGLFGSAAYVKKHFGRLEDPATRPTTGPATTGVASPATKPASVPASGPASRPPTLIKGPDYEKLSAYFNLDNGTGRIRGIYCQGNEAAMPIFKQWIEPFADLDARTVTLSNTGGTDHLSFDRIGLPGFQFIQDPMDYRTRTHHSNQDNFDRIQMQDLKQSSTIMAWFVWKAANEPERFPRKPLAATRRS